MIKLNKILSNYLHHHRVDPLIEAIIEIDAVFLEFVAVFRCFLAKVVAKLAQTLQNRAIKLKSCKISVESECLRHSFEGFL